MSASRPPEPLLREDEPAGAAADPMAGRVFGHRYRVVRRLGEGGMGAVYLCEHEVLGRRFAVKVLRADRAAEPELKERFRNEALAASRIGQENVVDVLDFGEEADGALYYVMEALEGRSLGAVIREEGPLPVGRALALLENVARALAAAHARGVIHRDVKPENVFVVRGRDGLERAKVLDFGISHVDLGGERITRAGAIIGTPEYMAPEQAMGGEVDHRADVYALGVLAFEMLTGALPLVGDSAVATLMAHQTRAPAAPSLLRAGIPPAVDALVLRALAKSPAERFDSMLELAGEVARIRLTGPLPVVLARAGGASPTVRFEPDEAAALRAPAGGLPPATPPPGDAPFAPVDIPLTAGGDPAPAPGRRRSRAATAAVVAVALAVVIAFAWWGSRGRAPAAGPLPAPEVTRAPVAGASGATAAPLAPRGEAATPEQAPTPPAPTAGSPAQAAAAERPPGTAARAPASRPARPRARQGEAPAPKDPYAEEAGLKPDPFR